MGRRAPIDVDEPQVAAAIVALARGLNLPPPDPAVLEAFTTYAGLVASWNARSNLVGAASLEDLVEVLFADALVLAPHVAGVDRVIDVGAGAGAPALPLALLHEDLHVVLVEPRRIRVAFLRTVVGALDLPARVEVREARLGPVNALGPAADGAPFDLALSRATFSPSEWLELGPAIARRTALLTLGELPPTPLGLEREDEVRYRLPASGRERVLALYSTVAG